MGFVELLLISYGCLSQETWSSKGSYDEISAAALESDSRCPSLLAALGKGLPAGSKNGEHEIPPICWSDAIKELKPVKVYGHYLNVAIVLSIKDGVEEGIYIGNPISNYMPFVGHVQKDRFEFERIQGQGHVMRFRRPPSNKKD
jgi:hypothetical protein